MEAGDKADVLYGLRAIAEHLGMTVNQAKHRTAPGQIPTFRIGGTVCARRSTLDAWLGEREAAARKTLEETPDA